MSWKIIDIKMSLDIFIQSSKIIIPGGPIAQARDQEMSDGD
jgi:hypothetical protein